HAHHRRHSAGDGSLPGSFPGGHEGLDHHGLRSFAQKAPLVCRRPVLAHRVTDTTEIQNGLDRRRLKWLWIGAGLFSLTFLHGLRLGFGYAGNGLLLIVILSEVFNGLILAAVVSQSGKYTRGWNAQGLGSLR